MSTVLEAEAAQELGVSRETVRSLRAEHLFENDHWKKKGREIAYTASGVERLRGLVARLLSGEGQDSTPEKNGAPEASQAPIPGVVTAKDAVGQALAQVLSAQSRAAEPPGPGEVVATVTRQVPNKHLVMARLADGGEIRVWVKTNKNFTPGMTLRATQRVGSLYDLVGNCPRFRGRF